MRPCANSAPAFLGQMSRYTRWDLSMFHISVQRSHLKIKRKLTIFLPPLLEHFPRLGLRKLKEISKDGNAFWSRWEVFVPLPSKEASRPDEE